MLHNRTLLCSFFSHIKAILFIGIISFSSVSYALANTVTVTRGAQASKLVLTWNVVGGSASCSGTTNYPDTADNINIGWVSSHTTINGIGTTDSIATPSWGTVIYAAPNTYTFSCQDLTSGAIGSATLIVNDCPGGTSWNGTACVNTPPAIGSFTVSTPIAYNTTATLSWSGVTNATTCSINGIGVVSTADGSVTTSNLTSDTSYTLTCTGATAPPAAIARTAVVNPPAPTVGSFTSNGPVDYGTSATLSWSGVANASTCSIDNSIGSVGTANGSVSTGNLTTTTTYTLTCAGATTPAAAPTVTVTVNPRPCNPQTITWGGSCSGSILGALSGVSNSVTNNVEQYSGSAAFQCNDSVFSLNPGSSCVSTPVSGSISAPANGSSCTIANGSDVCSRTFTWTTTNPIPGYTSQIVSDTPPGNGGHSSTPADSDTQSIQIKYGGENFRLYNKGYELAQVTVNADCVSSSAWNGSTCQACGNGGCTNHICNNTAPVAPTCTPPVYNINASAGVNGSISPSGLVSVTHGNDQTFTITPDSQYSILDVVRDGISIGRVTTATISNVINNLRTISATFTQPWGTMSTGATCGIATGNSTCNQTFNVSVTNPYGFSQIISDGGAGPDSPADIPSGISARVLALNHGNNGPFRIYNHGLVLDSRAAVTVECASGNAAYNGTTCQTCGNGGCTNHVCNNTASDAPTCTVPIYTINASAGANGTISPSGAVSVTYGNDQTFTVTPNSGYVINSVITNTATLANLGTVPFTHTFPNVTSGGSINATFARPTGFLNVDSNTCTIPVNQSSCTVQATWNIDNPYGTGAVTRNNPDATIYTANSGGPSSVTIPGGYPSTRIFLYNNAHEIASQTITTTCGPNNGWDSSSGRCVVDPQVISAVVTGNYYMPTGTLTIRCDNANRYSVIKVSDGSVFASGNYSDPTVITGLNETGDYQVICLLGNYPTPSSITRTYYAPPPDPEIVSLTATPRTINKDESTTIAWEIKYPSNNCSLTAKVVCAGGVCSQAQSASETVLNNKLLSESTDTSDPHTSRSISSAVKALAPGEQDTTWRGFGKKTFKISYTTDFTLACGAKSEVKRIQISKSTEQ